jgi:UDP-N-acetylmuramoyl-tripeptide--D-alanyl-D-alanine ligase
MPRLTPEFVARALGLPAADGAEFSGVVTDSRKLVAGSLFVAIPGEKFDGHDFVAAAVAGGATGILCRRGTRVPSGAHAFEADDSVEGFRRLAGAWRREFKIPVVAVVGSVGKTTTKELLAATLRGRFRSVLKTQGSQNGFVGIPMTLLELRSSHEAAVIEVGIDEIGAMEKHAELVGATAAILTAVGPEHLEKLRDVETVAREEAIALEAVAGAGGLAVANLDDPHVRPVFARLPRSYGYSLHDAGSERVLSGRVAAGALEASGLGLSGERFALPLPGAHNAGNLAGALALARGLGLSADELRAGLATFAGAPGRCELRELPGRTPVLCDYYNSNPTSAEAALETLGELAAGRERWACLADMLELGPDEEAFHRSLAGSIISLGLEHVLLRGERMRWLESELRARGFRGTLAWHSTHEELARALAAGARGGAVLIKGSRGMKMEEVWKALEPLARSAWHA